MTPTLHSLDPDAINSHEPWLALDPDSMILFRCQRRGPRIHITPLDPGLPPAAITSATDTDTTAAGYRIGNDVTAGNALDFRIEPAETISPSEIPEYFLAHPLDGSFTSIVRTRDPLFCASAPAGSFQIAAPSHYRSSVDLSGEGWAYWWEDAQRAFETQARAFIEAAGA